MENVIDFLKRNFLWLLLLGIGLFAPQYAKIESPELKTMFLIIAFEAIALFLSGAAVMVYTRIKFTHGSLGNNVLGYIFLGVHILVGLSVFSIYTAQFSGG